MTSPEITHALHLAARGQPVTRGNKHIASRWIRAAPPPLGEAFGAHEVLPSAAAPGQ